VSTYAAIFLAVSSACALNISPVQAFGFDDVNEALPTPAMMYPGDVRKQLEVLDPELASVIDWTPKNVPGLVPMTAQDYIAERELILSRHKKSPHSLLD
jgi:hypothetical protein